MTRHLVTVETDGAVFRGLAVPFGQSALIVDKGDQIIAEQFDERSIRALPGDVPLLVSHRRDEPPAGVITTSGFTSMGLGIEGRLIGSDAEIEGWRRKLAAGLMAGLSVGFVAEGRQEWRLPERRGAPPLVIRRGVEIVEVSLVNWGAYESAGMTSLNQRTAQRQREHEVAMEMVAEYQARKEQAHRDSERVIAETRAVLQWSADRLARRR